MKIIINSRYFMYDWPDGMEVIEENIQRALDFNINVKGFLEEFLSVPINTKYAINSINFDDLTRKNIADIIKAILEQSMVNKLLEYKEKYENVKDIVILLNEHLFDETIQKISSKRTYVGIC